MEKDKSLPVFPEKYPKKIPVGPRMDYSDLPYSKPVKKQKKGKK
jgi:hypothetical protein